MVAIGTCDYFGEFCSEVGLEPVEGFELASGWIPTSAIERHRRWSQRRYECADDEGHRGPFHDARGRRLDRCRHCYSPTHDSGGWDSTLDHSQCADCWFPVAGSRALRVTARIRPRRTGASTWSEAELARDPSAAALSTTPADRPRAERALRTWLGNSRLPVRWVASPAGIAQALQEAVPATGIPREVDVEFPEPWSIWTLAPRQVIEAAGYAGSSAASARAAAAARAVSWQASLDGGIAAVLGALLSDAGQFDPRTPDVIDDLVSGPRGAVRDRGFLRMLDDLRWSAGPVVLCRGEVVVSERPMVLRVDAQGRLHAEDGPSMAWADGLEVWSWHGTTVPEWVIREPERITVGTIDGEQNAEVRRAMVERFGVERLIRDSGSELVHEDATGRLWRRLVGPPPRPPARSWGQWMAARRHPHPPAEYLTIVEVRNATPEPDGTLRTYFLRVPPETRTAREGVAWTFGMTEREYTPKTET